MVANTAMTPIQNLLIDVLSGQSFGRAAMRRS